MTFRRQTEHVPYLPFVPVHSRDIRGDTPVPGVLSLKSHKGNMKNVPAPFREDRIYFKASIRGPVVHSKHEAQDKVTALCKRDEPVPEFIFAEFQIYFVFSHFS